MGPFIAPFLLHPLTHNVLQALLSVIVLGFTHPTSNIRLVALFISCLFPLLLFYPPHPVFDYSRPLSALFAGNTLGFFLQYLDAGILSRWSFEARGPTSAKGGMLHIVNRHDGDSSGVAKTKDPAKNRTSLERAKFGLWIALPLSTRLVNTPWQVTGTPDFPAKRVPSRSKILFTAVLRLVVCLLLFDFVGTMNGKGDGSNKNQREVFDWSRVPVFARLSATNGEEMLIRFGVSFVMWLIGYCVVQAIYSAMEIVALGSGLTGVAGWKPLFGSLMDCWSIRQFWGRFWHQSLRLRISNPAHYLVYRVLRFRKTTITGRYAMLFVVFLISGLFHLAEDVSEGMNWRDSGAVRYYAMQPLGIMLEDAVQEIYHRNWKSREMAPDDRLWEKMVGYMWFVAWMAWTTPAWVYPKARMATGGQQDRLLPFSILGIIL